MILIGGQVRRHNFLRIASIALLCIFFSNKGYLAYAESDTTNAIVSHHAHNKTFGKKEVGSERHRQKQKEEQISSKRLKKKMSRISWMPHNQITRVIITGNKNIETSELKTVVNTYLKRKITKKQLRRISEEIEIYYLKHGYLLPVAHAEIVNSILRIKIIEGKIKNVFVVFDDEKRDKRVLKNQLFIDFINKIKAANPMRIRELERYIALINKIHGYTVDYEIEGLPRIQGNNVADLTMTVATEKATVELSVDDKGSSDLGKYQFNFAAQVFNPISNDSLILNAGVTDRLDRSRMVTAGYLKRLNTYGTSAAIVAGYMEYDPFAKNGSKDSTTTVFKGQINQYLLINSEHSVKLEVGAEHRNIDRFSQQDKLSDYNYVMGIIGGKIKITDPLDAENWILPYFNWALKKVSYKRTPIDFDKNFNYFLVNWYREQYLPRGFSLFLKASYQYTDKLLPLEHIYSIGTDYTGRGYETGIVSGDQGISGTAEIRYTKEIDTHALERGQIFAFYDVTHFIEHNKNATRRHHPGAVYFNESTLPAVGAGVRLYLPWQIYAEGTAEFPTERNITIDGIKRKNKPLYRFLLSKEFNW